MEITSTTPSHVEPCLLGEVHPLGQPLDDAGDAHLIHHLGELPSPHVAHQAHEASVAIDDAFGAGVGFLGTTHHHGELAVLRTGLTTAHRRIEEADAALASGSGHFLCHHSRRRGVIHQHGACLRARKDAAFANGDVAHVVVVADAHEDDLGSRCRFGGRGRNRAAVLFLPSVGTGAGAVENGHLMPRLGKVPGHGIAHHAKPHKRHRRRIAHLPSLSTPCPNGGATLPLKLARPHGTSAVCWGTNYWPTTRLQPGRRRCYREGRRGPACPVPVPKSVAGLRHGTGQARPPTQSLQIQPDRGGRVPPCRADCPVSIRC